MLKPPANSFLSMLRGERRPRGLSLRIEPGMPRAYQCRRLLVPLQTSIADRVADTVKAGESITRGDPLAQVTQGDNTRTITAPASGRVGARCQAWTPGLGDTEALEILVADVPSAASPAMAPAPHRSKPPGRDPIDSLLHNLFDAEGQPLAAMRASANQRRLDTLIVRCFHDEPGYLDACLARGPRQEAPLDQAAAAIAAARRLAGHIGAERIVLALRHDTAVPTFKQWRSAARIPHQPADTNRRLRVDCVRVWAEYPRSQPVVLTNTLTGRETPPDQSTRSVGVGVLDFSTLVGLADAIEEGAPRNSITIFVGGDDGATRSVQVPIGVPVRELVNEILGERASATMPTIAGGWLSGRVIEHPDAVVDGSFTCLWRLPPAPQVAAPCIRCGSCADACPVGISPALLYGRIEESADRCLGFQPQACIGCGMCSYVCPSALPLASEINTLATLVAPSGHAMSVEAAAPVRRAAQLPDRPPFVSGRSHEALSDAWWLAAMLPASAGIVLFGRAALLLAVLCVAVAIAVERFAGWKWPRRGGAGMDHAALTGLLLFLTLSPLTPPWMVIPGAAAAVAIGHYLCGGIGRYMWQPALVGRIVVQLLLVAFGAGDWTPTRGPVLAPHRVLLGDLHRAAAALPGEYQGWRDSAARQDVDACVIEKTAITLRRAVAGSSDFSEPVLLRLVRDVLPPWEDTLLGAVPGGCGETSSITLLMAGLYLIYRGAVRWELPFGAVSAALIVAAVAPVRTPDGSGFDWFPVQFLAEGSPVGLVYVFYHLTSGQLLLAAFLLASDPTSSPLTRAGQFIYGLGVGSLTIILRLYGPLELEGVWAVLMMNTLVPWIDLRMRPRVLGTR